MAEKKDVVALVQAGADVLVDLRIADMTERAASAQIEVARLTFAVPAQEKTRQVGIETIGRMALGGSLAAVACITLAGNPITLGAVLVAIAGVFGGKPLIEAFKKKTE